MSCSSHSPRSAPHRNTNIGPICAQRKEASAPRTPLPYAGTTHASRRVRYEGCRSASAMLRRTTIVIYAAETRNISVWPPIIITSFDPTVNDGNEKRAPDAGCMAPSSKVFRAMTPTPRDFALAAAVQTPCATLNHRVPCVIEKWRNFVWITPARTHVPDMRPISWSATAPPLTKIPDLHRKIDVNYVVMTSI